MNQQNDANYRTYPGTLYDYGNGRCPPRRTFREHDRMNYDPLWYSIGTWVAIALGVGDKSFAFGATCCAITVIVVQATRASRSNP